MNIQYQILLVVSAYLLMIFGCNQHEKAEDPMVYKLPDPIVRDLDGIRQRGKLVVLTENSSVSYYLYRGQPMGYDYELLKSFSKHLGVQLEIIVIPNMNEMFDMLEKGEGDLIACNLTETDERKEFISFTEPLMETRQVLVQRKPEKWWSLSKSQLSDSLVDDWSELTLPEIYVHEYSSFHSRLTQIDTGQSKLNLIRASGSVDSEKLIRLVAAGEIESTVADENMAQLNQTFYPNLDVRMAISEPQNIAWAVRPTSSRLLSSLNDWILQPKTQRKIHYAHQKYFEAKKDQKQRVQSSFSSFSGDRISNYDQRIQSQSERLSWDWKLLAAMIHQESRFNPEARSWAGAFGLMQMMPATAERFGIDSTHIAESNIDAGVSYLKYLDKMWAERVPDKEERKKFVLASYNVGPGHVMDAQRIASYLNKDSSRWENNVADCLLLKSQKAYFSLDVVRHGYCRGEETFNYVSKVLNQYQHYQTLEL